VEAIDDNVEHLLQRQILRAERERDEIMRDAKLELLTDVQRWRWLEDMNERSVEQRCQVYPADPPPSIDTAA
jgi:hypothetical protein